MGNSEENSLMRQSADRGRSRFWSFADQGAVSLGNFLTNILLARSLSPTDYGIFALIYGMLILMNSYHSSAVVYPLSLSGAPGTIEELHHHLRRSICVTLLLAFPLGLVVFCATLFLKRPEITPWVVLALVCWQIQETLRRGLMAHLRHSEAVWGDAVSYLGQAVMIWIFLKSQHQSLAAIFGILAATSLLAAAVQIGQLRLRLAWEKDLLRQLKDYWRVSRWAVLANTAVVVPGVAYPWFLALQGTYLAASYQALLNIIGVCNPVMMSVGNVILPETIRANASGGWKRASRVLLRGGIVGAAFLLPCYALIFSWPGLFLRILYRANSPYFFQQDALRILVAACCLGYGAYLLSALFYGLGQSKLVFKVQSFGAAVALICGFPLVMRFGVSGACVGMVCVYASQLIVAAVLVKKFGARERALAAKVVSAGEVGGREEQIPSSAIWDRLRKQEALEEDVRIEK
jgi:O-antigen/teichoic acid export membrane protein